MKKKLINFSYLVINLIELLFFDVSQITIKEKQQCLDIFFYLKRILSSASIAALFTRHFCS